MLYRDATCNKSWLYRLMYQSYLQDERIIAKPHWNRLSWGWVHRRYLYTSFFVPSCANTHTHKPFTNIIHRLANYTQTRSFPWNRFAAQLKGQRQKKKRSIDVYILRTDYDDYNNIMYLKVVLPPPTCGCSSRPRNPSRSAQKPFSQMVRVL